MQEPRAPIGGIWSDRGLEKKPTLSGPTQRLGLAVPATTVNGEQCLVPVESLLPPTLHIKKMDSLPSFQADEST